MLSNEALYRLTTNSLKAYFGIHSDVPVVGKVTSSGELLNKIYGKQPIVLVIQSVGYPTDCPQRENSWTGVHACIAIETALYNYDGITVLREVALADHQDEQTLIMICITGYHPYRKDGAIVKSMEWIGPVR